MPMLVDTSTVVSSIVKAGSQACWIFQAIAAAPSRSVASAARIANSSPPSRATVSPSRSAATSRAPTCSSSVSPRS